jgi:hypothetical protein
MSLDASHILNLVRGAAALTAVALILRVPLKPVLVRGLAVFVGVALLCVVAGVVWAVGTEPLAGLDYRIFREVGRDVWEGLNPYAADRFAEHPFLHPPSALPLFALFALLPLRAGFLVWTALSLVAGAALVALAQWTLAEQHRVDTPAEMPSWLLPEVAILGLACALVLSDASLLTLALGQLSIMEAAVLMAALAAQARGQAVWAGVLLALATTKVSTMLPFVLLFLRKEDWRAWLALGGVTLALSLAAVPATELPERLTMMLERIRQLEEPGQVNDYSFEGTRPENILGFAHALYRVGLRDRTVIRVAHYAAVALLGAWVAWQVVGRRLPRAAACSLVALYSMLFLYHRNYDAVILALPLVYSTGQARLVRGSARVVFAGCALAIVLVLYLDIEFLRAVTRMVGEMRWGGQVLKAVVLPYATWLLLLAMGLLVLGTRLMRTTDPARTMALPAVLD